MGTVHPFELSHGLLGIQVNHFNLGAMRDVEPPCGLIDGKVILATVTGERDRLQEVVTRIRCREGEPNNEECDYGQFAFHPELFSCMAVQALSRERRPKVLVRPFIADD
jgi:hypothetical protein